jgi:hypothetical protein
VTRVDISRQALLLLLNTHPESHKFFKRTADSVRDDARKGARRISPSKADAIVSNVGVDSEGIYADVGYARHHPGFFLWWWEVGTRRHGAVPHLRPAIRSGRF